MDVDQMQTKLASWSQDQDFRFDDIYNLLYDEDWLHRAYTSVRSNSGSRTAGVDGQTIQDFGEDLGENLDSLARELKSQSYEPRPVRRTYIPKGDDEVRPLGIPTIKDRIVQEALRMVLEPIYETDFSDESYGFRPNRSTHDARMSVRGHMAPSFPGYKPWIIDADIKGFFDNVEHGTLGKILQDRITDRKMLKLIWGFLKAGIMEEGSVRNSTLGTPQGGIVSPILANIYLNELDQWAKQWTDLTANEMAKRWRRGKGNWHYVRYADDFLFMTNGRKKRAEKMMERVGDFVAEELDLTLSEKKSELIHATEGVSFLGYNLQAKVDTGGIKREVPKDAVRDIKSKIREATDGDTDISVRIKYRSFNAVLRGWANYYKFATDAARVFSDVENYAWHRLTHWLAEKYKCSRSELIDQKLDGRSRAKIGEMEMVNIEHMSERWTESPYRHDHPYLGDTTIEREETPSTMIMSENRKGWVDKRREALERDSWTCQNCDRDLKEATPHVHHRKPYSGYGDDEEANKLENLVSLCKECHEAIESNHYA